jgi:hypothetical protein
MKKKTQHGDPPPDEPREGAALTVDELIGNGGDNASGKAVTTGPIGMSRVCGQCARTIQAGVYSCPNCAPGRKPLPLGGVNMPVQPVTRGDYVPGMSRRG